MAFLELGELDELWAYMASVAQKLGVIPIQIGGMPDHAHLLLRFPPTVLTCDAVGKIKAYSSAWIKKRFPCYLGFAWQSGYSSFTVALAAVERVRNYIIRQRQRHETESYGIELKNMLKVADKSLLSLS